MPVSFDLTEDQIELQKWVHEFAANVVRPAAHEYDEREDLPWPVLQEAAKIGLYSLDFFATQWFDESGLGIPLTMEELFWGDAGIGLAIVGTTPRRGVGARERHRRAGRPVDPGHVRHRGRAEGRRVLLLGARRRFRRRRDAHPGGLRREDRRVGAHRHQDLGDQRRHRRHPRRRRRSSTPS